MLHLKTFGSLSVAVDGAPGSGAAQQPKTLALLALLAAASRHGISRDKVLAYLWPEADAEHARGLLRQACYALRRDLHQPDLFLGTTELRLNPAIIASDIQDFEAALERRDEPQAAALYTGPFLDGFYLGDSAEFERWVEAERTRLRQLAGEVLETLATDAGARGDHRNAVEWWRRLAALDRLNSRVALGLMHALAATGDRAGALQVARVHASLLREELDAAPDAAVVELTERLRAESGATPVPRTGAVPVTAAREVAATTGDTVADATAAPLDRSGDAARRPPMARRHVRLALAVIVGGLLTGGWLLLGAPFGARSVATAGEPKRLVILPFANLGPAEEEYFADGITEEITARLAAIGGLRVIGSTSAHAYKGTKKTLTEIGRELGVDYILEGSVRWQRSTPGPARVRVTPQLVSTADGTHLWAEVYDEPLDEIFRVQSDIAQKVVRALDVTLLEPQRRLVEVAPTANLQAYDYYLRGNEFAGGGMEERPMRMAVRMYEKAVELDSGFALAYARLSRAHSRMFWMYHDHSEDRLAKAKSTVDKALELEPSSLEAHHSLGTYYLLGHLDYDQALREFGIAAAKGTYQGVLAPMALLRQRQGRFREALAENAKALQLDPAGFQGLNWRAQTYDLLRDFARAETLYHRAIALSPERFFPYFWKAGLYLRWHGSTKEARAVIDEARTVGVADDPLLLFTRVLVDMFDRRYPEAIGLLSSRTPEVIQDQFRLIPRAQLYAQIYGLLQRHDLERVYYDSARSFVLRKVQEQPNDSRLHSALGIAYAGLGRKELAIQEGQRAVELLPISREAWRGYYRAWDLARIYAMVGEHDAAVELLEHLLSIPGNLTAAWLRIDPTWDPLRGHPRFQRLVGRDQ